MYGVFMIAIGVALGLAASLHWLRIRVTFDVWRERLRQDRLHGAQRELPLTREGERYLDPEGVMRSRYEARKRDGRLAAADYILEELAEAFDAATPEEQYKELVEAAACCVKAAEALLWQMKGGE